MLPPLAPIETDALIRAVIVVSDCAIALAYYAIPLGLIIALRRHQQLPFRQLAWVFIAFISACGTTHLMAAVQAFIPMIRLVALVEMVTAIISCLAAILLWVLLDQYDRVMNDLKEKHAA